jgi:hypothetical protein
MAKEKKDTPSEHEEPRAGIPNDFIEKAAYYHWEQRGRPQGDEWYDWLEAEKEIKEWMVASGILPPKTKKAPKK